jgi:hypothetical protein
MANRKQRRRRERTFRHDMHLVDYDEEGNEVEVTASELRAKQGKEEKPKQAAPAKKGEKRPRRSLREPPQPSWNRSLRRGGIWGGFMLVIVIVFFQSTPLAGRIVMGLIYAAAFIPLTYWIDRMAYRSYLKRSGKAT